MRAQPIGVFDSGVGGLSVWRELVHLLPGEGTIYLADQANVPYGSRPRSEIEWLTHSATAWLLDQGVKLVVIACNTASAAALESLRHRWPALPIVGMEPAVKPASEQTHTGKVGIMATPGTLQADRFNTLVEKFADGVEVYTRICPGLVELIEQGHLEGPDVTHQLQAALDPLLAQHIDRLVLGCTHYPFLAPVLQDLVGEEVVLVDPAPAVAKQVRRVLEAQGLLAPLDSLPEHRFFTTASAASFATSITRLVHMERPFVSAISLA